MIKEYLLPNGKKATIREAVKEDAEKLIRYIENIAHESDYLTFGPGEIDITKDLEERIIEEHQNTDNKIFLVVELDNEIIGCLNFAGGRRERLKHTGEFGVSVKKKYWNMGIATQLIKELINWANESNIISKINLKVREDNERALRLYEKLGFIREGRVTREFYVDGKYYDVIIMGLKI
jgi:RimJ/RimL family protein N-acetyltransferase